MVDKLNPILRMMFQRVSIERILTLNESRKVYYDQLNMDYLQDLMLTYYQQYTDTEMHLQIQEVQEQMNQGNQSLVYCETSNVFNVFLILLYYVEEVLTFCENRVVCKYQNLLEWNELTRIIGEDLAVVSLISKRDLECGREQQNFLWEPVIGHNNIRLEKILNRGMAENHFHLRGSAPYFDITWINLMNHPTAYKYKSFLEELEYSSRDKNKKSETSIKRRSFRELVFSAALIRFYLCSCLNDFPISLITRNEGLWDCVFSNCIEETFKRRTKLKKEVQILVADVERLNIYISDIQSQIDGMDIWHNGQDYMNTYVSNCGSLLEQEYRVLAGERWFLYQMVRSIRNPDDRFSHEDYNLFYAYLRIKNELRNEFVQCNNMIGFENFQIYQGRKDLFSHTKDWKGSEGMLARMAVRDVLNNPAVWSLELRISPANTAELNKKNIEEYDRAILKEYDENDAFRKFLEQYIWGGGTTDKGKDLKKRYYYVFHFTKRSEEGLGDFEHMECRHYIYRSKILRTAEAIINFRENYPQYGKRVLGIDACSQEIGCRPEVFGRVFRTLKGYTSSYDDKGDNFILPQLKITYHVGEDFLDVADGLRAVDEAIRFLGLDCGDRIGHALVLGVNVRDWYDLKQKQVTLTLQDYLDNIMWLHHALIKYNISDVGALIGKLESWFDYYFSYIYQQCIEEMQKNKSSIRFRTQFNISTYYLAWLLRGDKPSLYKKGSYERNPSAEIDQWERYAVNKDRPRVQDIRKIPEVALLYHMYHYNEGVRKRGAEKRTFSIPEEYIQGVTTVQKMMREELVERGIAVECNPSSNLRIGTFKSYSEHPIKVFYNLGLTKNEEELMECPQMNVSINTDDKGVFATRLENEYALLACALEKEKTLDGNKKYKKEFIYEWLDNIREMGLQQTFMMEENT